MIELTRLNKKKYYLNEDMIETVESTPDTVITLRNGKLLIAAESPEEIAGKVLACKRDQFSELLKGVLNGMKENGGPLREGAERSGRDREA